MSQIGWGNSTTAEMRLRLLLSIPQPLFLVAVLVPSVLFDPVFEFPFIFFHIFFTTVLAFYIWALYVLRREESLRHALTYVCLLSIAMWLLLAGVNNDPLYKRIWTGIYFQNVCLQSLLFTRNKFFI